MSQKEPIFPVYRHELENNMFITEKEGGGVGFSVGTPVTDIQTLTLDQLYEIIPNGLSSEILVNKNTLTYTGDMYAIEDIGHSLVSVVKINGENFTLRNIRRTNIRSMRISDIVDVVGEVNAQEIKTTLTNNFGYFSINVEDMGSYHPIPYVRILLDDGKKIPQNVQNTMYYEFFVNDELVDRIRDSSFNVEQSGTLLLSGKDVTLKAGDTITIKPKYGLLFDTTVESVSDGERFSVKSVVGEADPITYTVTEEDVPPTSE